ncbi:Plasmodium exported protein, unknown function [Plasmodium berghei]|uniref:Plasmodium RESA N-terminal domain-containing protein n=2 Tax=Plasmodium berghei TaxID=5821 RepID=A0A509ARN3_PLABA|nr:Plasmodium exported protein, unknown function [Plasmodium berghei ANKA]CXJ30121.1 Plasmodium exported protein, unknown function [Plasmodium berghei]SBW38145.1 Plasmodium exported protein, unknown function [Plasmodium berghei]SCL81959.1 Plasmodium exported protein, unknown function [Plasmodium berghei]SCL84540.1 Plasmodium exported protein, unknown function [Plasmodium berghei]SCL85979.1 Plasmodium exported protein, unknown function [Plasmodium berghei]|eukprot:XP_034424478.1 Plasmodium exported protein, unknown function [Plasmodium berghei ANKA]
MIAVILNLAILTFLQHGTSYQQPDINCYHNLTHKNTPYQNIKQNGEHLKRILRAIPQGSDDFLHGTTTQVENELEGINPETHTLFPEYSFPIINQIIRQECLPEDNTNIGNNEDIIINLLTNLANAHANNNGTAFNNQNLNTIPYLDSDFIMDRLNLIYSMDELCESTVNNMLSQYNILSDEFELTQEERLAIWNQSFRTKLEGFFNIIVSSLQNYNIPTPAIEAYILSIIEHTKIEFQMFLNSTRISWEASLNNPNNPNQYSQTTV